MDYPDSDNLQNRVDSIMTDYSDEERAPSTRRTYRKAWDDFTDFCEALEVEALPAAGETVAQYVLYCAEDRELTAATLRKRLSAVRYFHRKNEHRSPTREAIVEEAMEQIRRRQGTSQRQADPLLKSDVTRMLDALRPGRPEPDGTADRADWMRDIRDAALIAVGFAGAFRRGELRKIVASDLRLSADRVRIRLPQSKTDQQGRGETVVIPAGSTRHCPVRALIRWKDTAAIDEGPIFRSVKRSAELGDSPLTGRSVLLAVRSAAEAADVGGYITAHSLRAGYATQAVLNGVQNEKVMQHMRLSSVQTFMRYVRIAEDQTTDMTRELGL